MSHSGGKVLIIDDDGLVRKPIAAYLDDYNIDVLEANSGEEGLAVFQEKTPDVILCDLKMNGMQGLQVLETVRETNSEIPFIVISGHGTMDDVVHALQLGANNYLTKPIVLDMLGRVVEEAIDKVYLLQKNRETQQQLEKINQQLAAHLELLNRDQETARIAQEKMLPLSGQNYQGYHFNYKIYPSLYVSGDFVEFIPLNEHLVLFLIADVSGHGSSCAFVTVVLKLFINRLKERSNNNPSLELSPAYILAQINEELLSNKLDLHATVFLGLIDSHSNQLKYANAGHFPSPILSSADTTYYLEFSENDLAAGLFEQTQYQENTISLPNDFVLALFSDGIFEIIEAPSIRDKEIFILNMIKEKHYHLDEMANYLQINSETGSAPDDITLMTVSKVAFHEHS